MKVHPPPCSRLLCFRNGQCDGLRLREGTRGRSHGQRVRAGRCACIGQRARSRSRSRARS
jgi:hypothetical protein